MPKRKYKDSKFEHISKELKRLQEEIHRCSEVKRKRVRVLSSSSSESSSEGLSQPKDSVQRTAAEPCSEREAPTSLELNRAPATPDELGINSHTPAEAGSSILEPPNDDILELDAEILDILGVDPTVAKKFGNEIQKDIAVRFEHVATSGLSKDDRKELLNKYLVPSNCNLISAPSLNPEVKVALSEMVIKRDKAIESKQMLMACALSSLGGAITKVLSSKDKNTDLLRLLMDTGRTMCDCQQSDTITRRNFIIYSVKKEMKESLQNTKVDSFLFGDNLSETLKTAKAIHKSGEELKIPAPKPSTSRTPGTQSKNWKNPTSTRRAAAISKSKDTTTSTPMKNLHALSSRQSQSRRLAQVNCRPQQRR